MFLYKSDTSEVVDLAGAFVAVVLDAVADLPVFTFVLVVDFASALDANFLSDVDPIVRPAGGVVDDLGGVVVLDAVAVVDDLAGVSVLDAVAVVDLTGGTVVLDAVAVVDDLGGVVVLDAVAVLDAVDVVVVLAGVAVLDAVDVVVVLAGVAVALAVELAIFLYISDTADDVDLAGVFAGVLDVVVPPVA